jgi:hypothetical protein
MSNLSHALRLLSLFSLLLGSAPITHAATFYVASSTGNDSNAGSQVNPWVTLQHAADVTGPGDTVIVQPGTYAGAKFTRSGTAIAPITFQAQSDVLINTPGSLNTNHDNLWIRNANYIIIDGFEVMSAPRSGIAIQGEPHAPATGNVIRNNSCHDNGRWGIFTGYALNVVIEDNETSYSGLEHGVYVSNSADNPILRRNIAHHNHASGIQINADPELDGDGIISNALVEDNIIYENGVGGGAAINLASVRNSLIRNNLLYNNHASGIAGWDNGDGNKWGTKKNKFFSNTIVQAADGRFALVLMNGSTGNQIKNNILVHKGTRGSIEVDRSSLTSLTSDYNVVNNRFSFNDTFITLAQWQKKKQDKHSLLWPSLTALFVDANADNYHLASGSPAVNTGTPLADVLRDLDGQSRPQGGVYDIGAYERSVP